MKLLRYFQTIDHIIQTYVPSVEYQMNMIILNDYMNVLLLEHQMN